jgi:hypothetical protein
VLEERLLHGSAIIPRVTDDQPPAIPSGLLERLRADPSRAPEHLALAAAERHGPAARRWRDKMLATYAMAPAELARRAKRSHANLARFEGAATGVGGIFTVAPDLAALAWIQSRVVFYVAAAYGYDPLDPMRPAELLVLWELFEDPVAARSALDGVGGRVASRYVLGKLERDADEALIAKLSRAALRHGGRRFAGRFVPGFAILVNAVGNERATREIADRAIRFYGG